MLRFRNQQVTGIHVVEVLYKLDNSFQIWSFETEHQAVEKFVDLLEEPKFDAQLYKLKYYRFVGGRDGGWKCQQFIRSNGEIGYNREEQ